MSQAACWLLDGMPRRGVKGHTRREEQLRPVRGQDTNQPIPHLILSTGGYLPPLTWHPRHTRDCKSRGGAAKLSAHFPKCRNGVGGRRDVLMSPTPHVCNLPSGPNPASTAQMEKYNATWACAFECLRTVPGRRERQAGCPLHRRTGRGRLCGPPCNPSASVS